MLSSPVTATACVADLLFTLASAGSTQAETGGTTVAVTITNAGTIVHTSEIDAANETGVVLGQGPQLSLGRTATVTVRFTTKGSAYYRCSGPEHDEQDGETGFLAVA